MSKIHSKRFYLFNLITYLIKVPKVSKASNERSFCCKTLCTSKILIPIFPPFQGHFSRKSYHLENQMTRVKHVNN